MTHFACVTRSEACVLMKDDLVSERSCREEWKMSSPRIRPDSVPGGDECSQYKAQWDQKLMEDVRQGKKAHTGFNFLFWETK